ncbi:unnamed protein product [Clonostachys rosea f. rosea IK726]|uniref:Uncharacterized protein n=1 Tax=Clonostachys rosea f. rosea IK726 TaxID=1349383 RepID=A0ACA9TPC5_BIOOC|nr:unnamed protein product [Clonostachys rosea f. rosea IK726]
MGPTAAERCFAETFVAPHWLPGGQAFWYRRQMSDGKYKFIYVDVQGKSTRPAFDHEALAVALAEHVQEQTKIDPEALPFSWIELEDSHVRFRFEEQIWRFEPVKGLSRCSGTFNQGNPTLMRRREPSAHTATSRPVTVTFINNTRSHLLLNYADHKGTVRPHGSISQGKTCFEKTYSGVCWRLEDGVSRQLRGVYRVPDKVHDTVIVDEVDVDEYLGKEGENPIGAPLGEGDVAQVQEHRKTQQDDDDGVVQSSEEDISTAPHISVRDKILWLLDEQGVESQLTEANSSEESYWNDKMIFLCPNKAFAIAWYFQEGTTTTEYWIKSYPHTQSHPKLLKDERRLAGDCPRIEQPRLFSLTLKQEIEVTDKDLFSNHYQLSHLGWAEDGSEYRFLYHGRGHKTFRILGITCAGLVRVLYEESSDTFIDIASKLYYNLLSNSNKLILASERDGYNHLYLLDLEQGKTENQITKGEWNVHMVEHIDEESNQIWVSTYGFYKDEDPYHRHLVQAKLYDTECKALTEGDGTHLWSWSPGESRQYFVDSWSRVDLPPQTVVRCLNGTMQLQVEGTSVEELRQQGWMPPERFHCLGRDGETLIYGTITKPTHFNPRRSYPVLEDIYAGPQDFSTPKSFQEAVDGNRDWREEDYVIVRIDGMGTNWRSKKFHDVCYQNLNDAGFPDRIIWITKAAESREWMDISRVGIIGSSAGGQNAASALLHFGHFYKVAVADSGCHDNSLAGIEWAEQWLGHPVNESYSQHSNVTHAAKLPDSAKLMLIAGGLDHAVSHFATMRFVQQLNKANKIYELVFLPDAGHSCGRCGYGLKRAKQFLKTNLWS